MVVAYDGPLEERERILDGLGRRPVSFFQLSAMIASGELLFSDEAPVGGIAIRDDFLVSSASLASSTGLMDSNRRSDRD